MDIFRKDYYLSQITRLIGKFAHESADLTGYSVGFKDSNTVALTRTDHHDHDRMTLEMAQCLPHAPHTASYSGIPGS
jgi:hypothetical protein